MKVIAWGIIVGCFAVACIQDVKTYSVVNLLWWISAAAAIILLCLPLSDERIRLLPELLLFLFLQLTFFTRFYGKADAYGFCVCAIVYTSQQMGILWYLYQMLTAFGMLAIVQIIRKNVNEWGNLKVPVAFLPYITLAFLICLCYHSIC